MVVFNTQMHIITFLICLIELVFFAYQIVYYLSRPSDKKRKYYLILLYLLIQNNIISGLLPDKNMSMNIIAQSILSYGVSFAMVMYIPYYFYKAYELTKLKFHAYYGTFFFLLVPYIACFAIPYIITGNLQTSVRLAMVIPFFYALTLLYYLILAIKAKNIENPDPESKRELNGVFLGVVFFILLPVMAFFKNELDIMLVPVFHFNDGSQIVEVLITNASLLVFTILFIRQTVRQAREEYIKLQESEKALLELNNVLVERVKERTKELELANEKRINLFVNLAHETKTPLTLINNYFEEYISKNNTTKELEIIRSSLGKLTKDIVNFFDLERINKGFNIYNDNQFSNFSDILKECLVLFKQYALKKNIIITEFIENNLFVKAAPESLHRIINNLLENSIKYTQENGKITVDLKSVDTKVKFSVIDNGIGIAPELQTNIFQPYYQINSEKANSQGMGLGLTITKKIVDSLNGTITINSNPLQKSGTEIIINITHHLVSGNEVISALKDSSTFLDIEHLSVANIDYREDRATIMIVEDNTPLLNFMIEKLQEKYNIYYAQSGDEAFEKLKTIKHLDLLVSDIMMDNGTGFELYEDIQSQERFRHIPVIFLTAKATIDDKIQGLALGAIGYIFKPFMIDELTTKIDSVINNLSLQRKAIIDNAYNSLFNRNNEQRQPQLATLNINIFDENCKKYFISIREKEIILLLKKGQTHKEIANNLCISSKTVAKHVQNIFEKAGVTHRLELFVKLEESVLSQNIN